MTWTYDLSDLGTSEKDQIRLEVGDNNASRQLLADEEINHFIAVERNFWGAAARSCEAIGRKFFQNADSVRLGRALQLTFVKRGQQYMAMAAALRRKALGTQVPYVGGMFLSDKQAYDQNLDLLQPAFTRTMMTNPRTGGYTSDSVDGAVGAPTPGT